jgi:hypothetical protein
VRLRFLAAVLALLLLAGCGSSGSGPTSTPTPTPSSVPTSPASTPHAQVTPTAVVSATYLAFVKSLCRALTSKNSAAVTADLPYYQYNSGLRWGMMGDGEGHSDDPSELNVWLSASNVRCTQYTPNQSGHGTLLARGWTQPGPWSLIEFDVYPSGKWKINDFTFGSRNVLYRAMQTAGPPISFPQ